MKWISVEDDMPNVDQEVIATDGYEVVSAELCEDTRGRHFVNFVYFEGEITHWMPLPKLPEPKTKQESLFDINEIPPFDYNQIKRTVENALVAQGAIGRLCDKNGNFIKTVHVDEINNEQKCNDWKGNLMKLYKKL